MLRLGLFCEVFVYCACEGGEIRCLRCSGKLRATSLNAVNVLVPWGAGRCSNRCGALLPDRMLHPTLSVIAGGRVKDSGAPPASSATDSSIASIGRVGSCALAARARSPERAKISTLPFGTSTMTLPLASPRIYRGIPCCFQITHSTPPRARTLLVAPPLYTKCLDALYTIGSQPPGA